MYRILLRHCLSVLVMSVALTACSGAESRKASFVAQAEKHVAAHDWQKARIDIRNALQIDPKDRKLQLMAAQTAERAGEFGEAAERYRSLIEQDKTNVVARAALARLYAGGGAPAEAIKLAEEGLAIQPGESRLLTVRGAARAMRGAFGDAAQDAEAAYARTPEDPDTAVLMASILERNGRREDALAALARAAVASPDNTGLRVVYAQALENAGRISDAEQQLLAVVKLEPRELAHRYRVAQFYVQKKDVDAAEQTLRQAVAAFPEDVGVKLALANLIASQRSFAAGEKSLRDLVASDQKNLELQLALGQFYEAHQRAASAEDVYRHVVAAGGANAPGLAGRNRMAALAQQSNRGAEATALIDEVLKISPRDNEALTTRAGIALARGDTTGAIADLRAVLRDQPNAPALMRELAAAYAANHDVGLAEETLRGAIRANPNDVQLRLALADLLMKSGRGSEAQPVADQLVSELPGDVRAMEAAFRVQMQQRDFAAARKSAQGMLSLRPDLPAGDFLTGVVDEAESKLDAARTSYERAARLAPAAVEPLAAAVRIDLMQKQSDRGLARVEQALSATPNSSRLLSLKSEVLAQLGRYDESVDAANRAIIQAPSWWIAYEDLARAELGRRRPEAAVATYQRGVEATQWAPSLVLQQATLLERLGRIGEAIDVYEQWLKRTPGSEVASNNLAMLLVTHKSNDPPSLDRAMAAARRLETSTQPAFIDTLGWVHYMRGEYRAAVDALQRAVAVAPSAPVLRAHLGLAQFKAGRLDDARQNLKIAADSKTPYAEADEVRATLAKLRVTN